MALGLEASGLEYFTWRDNIKSFLGIYDASYVHGSLTCHIENMQIFRLEFG